MHPPPAVKPHVGLFITCLVDLFRPTVGFAAVKLLEDAGCTVAVPAAQTCCGQPAYNSGDRTNAQALARQVIAAFETFDYVVAPSGSCGGMIKHHYPNLFHDEPGWKTRAERLSAKTFELASFLTDVLNVERVSAAYAGVVTYHDSCSGLRELNVKLQPRRLLASVNGLSLREMEESEVCCGFGGSFCVKYPELSNRMISEKVDHILASGADTVLAGDLGCLLNMAGKLHREGATVQVRHVAEVLADLADIPAIGEPDRGAA
ncbi:MAG TPA: (Fe-S)-binding protein [Candidatus Contendobacter sp.]|nr:(Fe-S)-binding protein [Candidatus Contendobacter sp.]